MKDLGYGAGYEHAHQSDDAVVGMQCLPDSLAGARFYWPTNRGLEAKIRERMEQWLARRAAISSSPSKHQP
jgi:putative ATPase